MTSECRCCQNPTRPPAENLARLRLLHGSKLCVTIFELEYSNGLVVVSSHWLPTSCIYPSGGQLTRCSHHRRTSPRAPNHRHEMSVSIEGNPSWRLIGSLGHREVRPIVGKSVRDCLAQGCRQRPVLHLTRPKSAAQWPLQVLVAGVAEGTNVTRVALQRRLIGHSSPPSPAGRRVIVKMTSP